MHIFCVLESFDVGEGQPFLGETSAAVTAGAKNASA